MLRYCSDCIYWDYVVAVSSKSLQLVRLLIFWKAHKNTKKLHLKTQKGKELRQFAVLFFLNYLAKPLLYDAAT